MAPFRGRGGFRGRGAGRGASRGAGRGGRGRGGRGGRGGARPARDAFTKSRIEDPESDSDSPDMDDEPMQSDLDEDVSSGDDDEEEEQPATTARPYSTLLQSLQQNVQEGPTKKRRKLDHPSAASPPPPEPEELEEEADEDDAAMSDVDPIDEDEEDLSDPFEAHFAHHDDNELARKLKAISEKRWETRKSQVPSLGRCATLTPDALEPPKKAVSSPDQLKIKQKLAAKAKQLMPEFNDVQKGLAPSIFAYQDVLFGARSPQNAESLRQITCLHALNHIFKTRDKVLKNNARLAKDQANDDAEVRDQGFTRPKVLMLLETRQSCVRTIDTIMQLCEPEQQENKKRFLDTFSQSEDRFTDDKPEDFRELFEGNDDNEYRMGLKFTRKTVKYFSKFYNSDIIFASPLGLRRAIEGGGEKKKSDYDFLSSIELVIMDQADAMLMQNWEHVEYVFEHLNLQPKDAHGCDFSRVRHWYLENQAAHLRQTIVLSAYLQPELNSLFNTHMRNVAGKAKFQPEHRGTLLDIGLPLKQTFSRYDSPSPAADPDARFQYFTSAILPALTRLPKPSDEGGPGVLVFIPSYLDFVRVRNHFATSAATQHLSFGAVSEYTDQAEVRRARSHFVTGRHAVLLYTGRAHHFRRYRVRGVRRVVLYALPENPLFYAEMVAGFLGGSIAEGRLDPSEASVRAVFSKWDGLQLERIVGTKRVAGMLREKSGDTFDFV